VPRRPDMPPLHRSALADDPIEQFREWYERAEREVPLAQAMTLATVDADGAPDARMVLLKGFGPEAFRFFTNLASAKARQLEAAPRAALVLYWRELDRQVRVRGPVEPLPEAASEDYFASRPREAQIGAWASPQSAPIPDRAALDARVADVEGRFSGGEVPRPAFWGGYALRPEQIEFWQGQGARLLRPALGLANRPIAPRGLARKGATGLIARRLEDRPAVTLAELSRGEQVEDLVGKVEEADQVRDGGAAATEPARELLLAQPQVLDQCRTGARLVHRVEVLPGHVLDQGRL